MPSKKTGKEKDDENEQDPVDVPPQKETAPAPNGLLKPAEHRTRLLVLDGLNDDDDDSSESTVGISQDNGGSVDPRPADTDLPDDVLEESDDVIQQYTEEQPRFDTDPIESSRHFNNPDTSGFDSLIRSTFSGSVSLPPNMDGNSDISMQDESTSVKNFACDSSEEDIPGATNKYQAQDTRGEDTLLALIFASFLNRFLHSS